MINRRGLLLGLTSALAAPAIVHAGNLMPIKVFAERIWLGDIFYAYNFDVARIATENGWSNKPIHWREVTAYEWAHKRIGDLPLVREVLPDHFSIKSSIGQVVERLHRLEYVWRH